MNNLEKPSNTDVVVDPANEAIPITGDTIDSLVATTSVPFLCYFIGVSPSKLSLLRRAGPNELAPKYALIVRYLLQNPNAIPADNAPTPPDLFSMVDMPAEYCARLLGYQRGAASRLVRVQSPRVPPSTVRRYMSIIADAVQNSPEGIEPFVRVAEAEARARGQDPKIMWSKGWLTKADKLEKATPLGGESPMSGDAIGLLAEQYSISFLCYYLGMSPTKLSTERKKGPNMLATHLSLLLRYLTANQHVIPVLDAPTPEELFARIQSINPLISDEQCSRMLGYQKGLPFRLKNQPGLQPPATVRRYMKLIMDALDESPRNLDTFILLAEEEARARKQQPKTMWSSGWTLYGSSVD